MTDMILNNVNATNVSNGNMTINNTYYTTPSIISIQDAISTENDKALHKRVIVFLEEQLHLATHFSDIIKLEDNHFIPLIREIEFPAQNVQEEVNPYKQYQLAISVLPTIKVDGEEWFFFQGREFIYFKNQPYALMLLKTNRIGQYGYEEGYRPNHIILDLDMLAKVQAYIIKNLETFEVELNKTLTQYSHTFFNVVMVEIGRLKKLCQELLEKTTAFISEHQRAEPLKPKDGSDRFYKRTRTLRQISMGELGKGIKKFDEFLFSTTDDFQGILRACFDAFNAKDNK